MTSRKVSTKRENEKRKIFTIDFSEGVERGGFDDVEDGDNLHNA